MARKRTYTPSGTSIGFTSRAGTQQASVGNIEKQTRTIVGGLERSAADKKSQDELYIAGLSRKFDFEEGVLKTNNKLNQQHRQHLREAAQKKADTHVARLQGEADELKKEADYLADLAPKRAKMAGELAKAAYMGVEFLEFQQLGKEWEKFNRKHQLTEKQQEEVLKIDGNAFKDGLGLSKEERRTLERITGGLEGNIFWQNRMITHFNNNRKSFQEEVNQRIKDHGIPKDHKNIYDVYEWAGYLKLMELNVSSTSKAGKQIIEQYRSWGSLKKGNLTNEHDAREDLKDAKRMLIDVNRNNYTQAQFNQNFNKLVIHLSKSTYKLGEDKFQVGLDDGYGGGFSKALEMYMEENPEQFKTKTDLFEFLEGLKVVDDTSDTLFSKSGKGKLWTVQHEARIEEVWEKHAGFLDKKKKELALLGKAENNTMIITITEKIQEHKNGGGIVDGKFQNSIIKEVYEGSAWGNVSIDDKNTFIENQFGYNIGDLGGFNNVTLAIRALNSGELQTAGIALDRMDDDERKKFESNFGQLRKFNKGWNDTQSTTTEDWADQLISINQVTGPGKGTNGSHDTTSVALQMDLIRHFNEAPNNGIPEDDIAGRIAYARKMTTEDFNNGSEVKITVDRGGNKTYTLVDPKPGASLDNKYNYLVPQAGVNEKGRFYYQTYDLNSDHELRIQQLVADGDVNKLPTITKPLSRETIWNTTEDKDTVLQHPRFATSEEHKNLINWAKDRVDKDHLGKGETVLDYMPSNLKEWADRHQIPYTTAVNEYLSKAQGQNWGLRVSLDGTDVVKIKKIDSDKPWTPDNTQVVVPKYDLDFVGLNAFYAAQANGVLPMSKEVRTFFENEGDSDLMSAFSASNKLDVSTWTDEQGITQINIPKYEDFYKKGGQQHFTWEHVKSLMPSETNLAWKDGIGWYNTNKVRYRPLPVADEIFQQKRLKKKRKKNPNLYGIGGKKK